MKIIVTSRNKAANENQLIKNQKNLKTIDREIFERLQHAVPHLNRTANTLLLYIFHKKEKSTEWFCNVCSIDGLTCFVEKINPTLKKYGLAIINYPSGNLFLGLSNEQLEVSYWKLVALDVEKKTKV